MEFSVGDHVVHPLQGIGTVQEIRETTVLGERLEAYVIRTTKGMEIVIPVEKAAEVGLRPIARADDVERILRILRSPSHEEPFTSAEGWFQRFEDLKNRLRAGDAETLAETVRDLAKNAKVYELNVKEQEILRSAKELLVHEIALAAGISRAKAAEKVEDALKANVRKKVVQ